MYRCVERLLEWGLDAGAADCDGLTPLHHAANCGSSVAVVESLFAHWAHGDEEGEVICSSLSVSVSLYLSLSRISIPNFLMRL